LQDAGTAAIVKKKDRAADIKDEYAQVLYGYFREDISGGRDTLGFPYGYFSNHHLGR
jgi:hypothetical protein